MSLDTFLSERLIVLLYIFRIFSCVFMRIYSYLQHIHCVEFNCLFPFTLRDNQIARITSDFKMDLINRGNLPEWSTCNLYR